MVESLQEPWGGGGGGGSSQDKIKEFHKRL